MQLTGLRLNRNLARACITTLFCIAFTTNCEPPPERLNAGGSTFVYPIMSKWAIEYNNATHIQVNYQSIGSGGGIQQMTAKTFDFGCSDSPMNAEQLNKAHGIGGEVVHIPLVMGAVVPAYNLPQVKTPLRFTGALLADMFLGKIKKWNDREIAALNPEVTLPDEDITIVHRSDGSGTTYIWLDYLSKTSVEWKSKVGVGTSVNWPAGVGQKGNEGVAGQIRRQNGSIGYIELTYALQNNMQFGEIKNHAGVYVKGSLESVTAAARNSLTKIPDDLRYSITDALGADSYPVSGTIWAIMYVNQPKEKGKSIVNFLRWLTHDGQKYAAELHYASLPPGLVARIDKKLDSVKIAP